MCNVRTGLETLKRQYYIAMRRAATETHVAYVFQSPTIISCRKMKVQTTQEEKALSTASTDVHSMSRLASETEDRAMEDKITSLNTSQKPSSCSAKLN